MLFIFSTPGLIRNLWQLKTVFLHWCLICAVPLDIMLGNSEKVKKIVEKMQEIVKMPNFL